MQDDVSGKGVLESENWQAARVSTPAGTSPGQTDAWPFPPVAVERLSARVAQEVRSAILEGRYVPGDRLPSEKALAEQFGVSRNVVREALKGLESVGLLEVRRGSTGGAFVRRASPRSLTEALYTMLRLEGFEVSNLHEARLILEPAVAALAAKRATPLGMADLERSLERTEEALRVGGQMTPAVDMHTHLARMTGNPILELLVGLVTDLLQTSRVLHPSPIDTSPDSAAEILRHHRAIFGAVANREPDRTYTLMRDHLLRVSAIESGTSSA